MSGDRRVMTTSISLDGLEISKEVVRLVRVRLAEIGAQIPKTHRRVKFGRLTITWKLRKPSS